MEPIIVMEETGTYHLPILGYLLDKENQFITEIDKIAKKLGHKGTGITSTNKIYTLAQNTIPPRPNNKYSQLSASSCVHALIITIKTSNTILTEMDKLVRGLPEYDVLKETYKIGFFVMRKIFIKII